MFAIRSLLTTAVCSVLAIAISAAADGQAVQPSTENAGPQGIGSQQATLPTAQTEAANANVVKAKASLIDAMATMVPGGIQQGSPRETEFLKVLELFRTGKVRESLDELKRMATADTNLPPGELMMAGISFAVGDPKSGTVILEKSALDYPEHPSVFLSFAQLALNEGRVTDAQVQAEKSASLMSGGNFSPDQTKFFQGKYFELMSGVHLRRRQYDAAKATLERLNTINPDSAPYFVANAELLFQSADYDGALDQLTKYAEATKQTKKPVLTLIEWMQRAKKDDLARTWMEKALGMHPADSEIQLTAARFAMAQENFQAALVAIRNFEKEKGEAFATKDMKGRIAFAKQAYGVAESHFEVLNKNAPKDINYANVYALCLIESNNAEKQQKAKQISQSIARSMPDNSLAMATLGYIHLKLDEVEESKALFSRVKTNSVSPEISYFISHLFYKTGQVEQAEKILTQSTQTKSLFLYRSAAQELLAKIKKGTGGLPAREN
jgi:predicted Zn-dependent protease